MNKEEIIALLPYTKPFLFVDEIEEVGETSIRGNYTFPGDSFFYEGHFKNHPVTPGVILTECMAQIGLVSLGIYLLRDQKLDELEVAFTSSDVAFLTAVYPKENVTVIADIEYFRFNKLKCKVKLINSFNKIAAQGVLAGVFKTKS